MNNTLFTNFQSFRASLNGSFLDRADVIDGLLTSLITKQNAFLFGPPGTGKSELVRAITGGFDGSKYFGYLLSPTTDPSELYGPVAVSKLLKDEYTRDVSGYLPDCNVAFLDELFRGSSAVLNSLLQILNERTFNNGKEAIDTEIQSIVAATNSFPTEEALQAFCDRFLFRPTITGLKSPTHKRTLMRWAVAQSPEWSRPKVESNLTYKDLVELQKQAAKTTVPDAFIDQFAEILDMLESRGISVSDRRRVQILSFMKGWAVVQGETEVHAAMLHQTLKHIIYTNPDEIEDINEVVKHVVPTAEEFMAGVKRAAQNTMRRFESTRQSINDKTASVGDLNRAVTEFGDMLRELKVLNQKAEEELDNGNLKFTAAARLKFTKIIRELDVNINTITTTISRFKND